MTTDWFVAHSCKTNSHHLGRQLLIVFDLFMGASSHNEPALPQFCSSKRNMNFAVIYLMVMLRSSARLA